MKSTRRRLLAGSIVLALAPALVACGDDSESPSGSSGTDGTSSSETEEGAFPVTIEHKYGSTEITEAPERVVVVGLTDQDALLALGVVPVGVTYWYGDEDLGGIYPWAEEAIGDAERPEMLDNTNGTDVEAVAALAPDLIIGQYAGLTQKEYDLLSKLAPTVAQPGDYADFGVPWEEATVTIGKAVGQPEAAQGLVDGVLAQLDDEAAAHPEFAGRSAVVVTPYEGLFVYGPEDPRARILEQLGFEFPENLLGAEGEEFGGSLSSERTSDLDDVDVTVWLGLQADKTVADVYESTSSFQEGRFVDIDDQATENYAVAHSFVSVLSLPYVLERYVPQLAAAVDGDPATEVPTPTD
jgi:iron complex transport system substrate-binding protein